MKTKKIKRMPRAGKHFTFFLFLTVFLLWLVSAILTTWAMAITEVGKINWYCEYETEHNSRKLEYYAGQTFEETDEEKQYNFYNDPDYQLESLFRVLYQSMNCGLNSEVLDYSDILTSGNTNRIATASYFADGNGNILLDSGRYFHFDCYYDEAKQNPDGSYPSSWAYIDLDKLNKDIGINNENVGSLDSLKIVGTKNGREIQPYRIISFEDISSFDKLVTVSQDEDKGTIIYEAEEKPQDELRTFYYWLVDGFVIETGDTGFCGIYNGQKYTDLNSYLLAGHERDSVKGIFRYETYDTTSVVDESTYNEEEGSWEKCVSMTTVFYCSPLKFAMYDLRRVYVISAIFAMVVFFLMRSMVYRRCIRPLEEISKAYKSGRMVTCDRSRLWKETEVVLDYYREEYAWKKENEKQILSLKQTIDYAREVEENRRRLTSAIAHELKTPLAVIHSYSEGLKENIAQEKKDHYLEIIMKESERMDDMVMEMLDFSRLESGRVKLSLEEVSIDHLAESCLEKFDSLFKEKNFEVNRKITKNCIVMADENRIGQVMDNFLSNAVRYAPEGARLMIKVGQTESNVKFSIENSGTHISEEELGRVWETFYKSDKSRNKKGTGLGLAIARNIIKLHDGQVYVENTEDGVRFGFSLKR